MKHSRSLLQRLGVALGVLLFATTAGGAIVYFIKSIISGTPAPVKQIVQEVRIIRPPPPPPEEPPPPEVQDEVKVPEPEEQPQDANNDPPPGEQLGLDAEGTTGGDDFGLMARKGGRDLLATNGGAFAWYTGQLKNAILERLQDNKRLRGGSYSVVVRLWLKADGGIERVQLASSTGSDEIDQAIEGALSNLTRVAQAPPLEMPQPVSLRIVSRI
ncbi:MAG TPA: TonB C-terminal domain-containing protein [Steroidobacteraceae bacterium]|nr:TonB C-terminal domain-containing protein [Steroidobacteraceae bacterium]